MNVLVTGATGFIGRALTRHLAVGGYGAVRGAVRGAPPATERRIQWTTVADVSPDTDWSQALRDIDAIVHLAARVHVMREESKNPAEEYRRTNVGGTLSLARHAAAAGVKRMVFVSSVKVHGEQGLFRESDTPAPSDAYAASKLEAELGLRALEREAGMQVVVVRPPLVYGPGVRGNFKSLMRVVSSGIPLPLAAIDNRRSLIALDNLLDFLERCLSHPAAAGETFLVSDGVDLSTADLVRHLSAAMNRKPRLLSVPPAALRGLARVAGASSIISRVAGSLQVDITKARTVLDWTPPVDVDEGLRRAVAGYTA